VKLIKLIGEKAIICYRRAGSFINAFWEKSVKKTQEAPLQASPPPLEYMMQVETDINAEFLDRLQAAAEEICFQLATLEASSGSRITFKEDKRSAPDGYVNEYAIRVVEKENTNQGAVYIGFRSNGIIYVSCNLSSSNLEERTLYRSSICTHNLGILGWGKVVPEKIISKVPEIMRAVKKGLIAKGLIVLPEEVAPTTPKTKHAVFREIIAVKGLV
jgi:hypothetical protein